MTGRSEKRHRHATPHKCSGSLWKEGRRECTFKDDSKLLSLKEGRKMVRNRKVRKRDRFSDQRKSLIMNIFHISHIARHKFECSQIPNSPWWGKKWFYNSSTLSKFLQICASWNLLQVPSTLKNNRISKFLFFLHFGSIYRFLESVYTLAYYKYIIRYQWNN